MKIAITGHTSGIGKAVANEFSSHGHEIIGFSRSNGYDISISKDRHKIITECKDADIFINNAYAFYSQLYMFIEIFHSWKNCKKTIININSQTKYFVDNHSIYNLAKRKLQSTAIELSNQQRKCKIINISPGYVQTPRIKNLIKSDEIMQATDLAKYIKWCVDAPANIEITELSLKAISDK